MLTLVGMKKYTILFIMVVISFAACKKAEKAKEKPELAFAGLSHDKVMNGDLKDTVLISLRYTIAASQVGQDSTAPYIAFKDSRDQTVNRQYFPNDIAQNLPDADMNISGAITIRLNAGNYFVLRPDRPEGDTLRYEMYLVGKDGVESNKITTPDIYIEP